jgi:tRNA(Ile)-lysidine synthase
MARPRRLGGPGYALVEQARTTIERHGMLVEGDAVVVAVSGGADSTALLDVLARVPLALELAVAHVDHGLSPGSAEVAGRLAREVAADGFDLHLVRAPDLAGPNLQARARAFRYGFLETVAAEVGARRIATGHTLDDRVETTLARLVHGAGTEGLAGIPPVEAGRVRPLIAARRAETRAHCVECGLAFDDDPANDDTSFERVAVRNRLVAAIEEGWGDGAVRAIATSSARLREDALALRSLADRLYGELASAEAGGVALDRAGLDAIPRALRRRLLEKAVGRVRDRSGGIEAALDALQGRAPELKRFAVAAGVEIVVGPELVRVRRAGAGEASAPDRVARERAGVEGAEPTRMS